MDAFSIDLAAKMAHFWQKYKYDRLSESPLYILLGSTLQQQHQCASDGKMGHKSWAISNAVSVIKIQGDAQKKPSFPPFCLFCSLSLSQKECRQKHTTFDVGPRQSSNDAQCAVQVNLLWFEMKVQPNPFEKCCTGFGRSMLQFLKLFYYFI